MKLYKKKSSIEGNGLFTASEIKKDEYIGTFTVVPAIYETKFTIYHEGLKLRATCILKYSNHSENPNAWVDDDLNMWALKDIKAKEEITWEYLYEEE